MERTANLIPGRTANRYTYRREREKKGESSRQQRTGGGVNVQSVKDLEEVYV